MLNKAERDEVVELVLAAQGDEALYMARALEANAGLIAERCAQSSVSGLEYEELISEMKIGAIKAIRSFNASRGKWPTHLYTCLKYRMNTLIKQRQNNMRYKMDATEVLHDWDIGSYDFNWWRYRVIEGLEVRDACLLELFYLHGYRMAEIGRVCGMKTRAVQYRKQAALDRARELV